MSDSDSETSNLPERKEIQESGFPQGEERRKPNEPEEVRAKVSDSDSETSNLPERKEIQVIWNSFQRKDYSVNVSFSILLDKF